MGSSQNKKIAIIFWEGYISVSPTIYNLLILFKEKGLFVDVVTKYSDNFEVKDYGLEENINIFRHEPYVNIENQEIRIKTSNSAKRKVKKRLPFFLQNIYSSILQIKGYYHFYNYTKKALNKNQYDIIIGVDTFGLITGYLINKVKKSKLFYLSLEINNYNKLTYFSDKIFKLFERKIHQQVKCTIIQDKYRLAELLKENKISNPVKSYLIPNGSIGVINEVKNNFFHERFNLNAEDIIILNAGMISESMLSLDLAKQSLVFPPNWKLVLHERMKRDLDEPYIIELNNIKSSNLCLSLEPVEFKEINTVFSSAHIGIVVYNIKEGPNFTNMVGASGKNAQYLKSGLPIVCLNLPGYKELIDTYNCGVVINELSELTDAIKTILSNYKYYQTNAFECYKQEFEFTKFFNIFYENEIVLN